MPDTTWPVSRHPPGSSRAISASPVSMSSVGAFDTSTMDRSRSSSWPTPDALTARLFPRRSPPTALDRSSSGWFAASPYRTAAEDRQPQTASPSISDAAPHQSARSSTSTLLLRSWHTQDCSFAKKQESRRALLVVVLSESKLMLRQSAAAPATRERFPPKARCE
jgi:hypothetical protein